MAASSWGALEGMGRTGVEVTQALLAGAGSQDGLDGGVLQAPHLQQRGGAAGDALKPGTPTPIQQLGRPAWHPWGTV